MTMNKITYESEMLMHEAINVSCEKIEVLRQAVRETTNQIVIDALHMEIKQERNAMQRVLRWASIN